MIVIFHNVTLYGATVTTPDDNTLAVVYSTSDNNNPTLDEIKEGFSDDTEYDYIRVCDDNDKDDGDIHVLNEYFAYLKYSSDKTDDIVTLTFTKPDLETRMNHVVKLACTMRANSSSSIVASYAMLNDSAAIVDKLIDDALKTRR
ncbi:hypothetical protein [Bacteroides acidifaciens]|uniref:hypothetical protein n=1 Tax=Bacteroides acidifaciens TaxID=85831 RepID=UPI0026EFB358|nr:hypothetical protein [Bacteroides acidifaciens]